MNVLKFKTKYLTATSLVILINLTSSFSQNTKVNFSGNWVINVSKSDFGKISPEQGSAKEIKIYQKTEEITFNRYFVPAGPSSEIFQFDGRELKKEISNQNSKTNKTSSLKWSEDGKNIVISSKYNVNENNREWEYTRTETYSVSENGKELTLTRVTVIPDRTDVVKAVYDKMKETK